MSDDRNYHLVSLALVRRYRRSLRYGIERVAVHSLAGRVRIEERNASVAFGFLELRYFFRDDGEEFLRHGFPYRLAFRVRSVERDVFKDVLEDDSTVFRFRSVEAGISSVIVALSDEVQAFSVLRGE